MEENENSQRIDQKLLFEEQFMYSVMDLYNFMYEIVPKMISKYIDNPTPKEALEIVLERNHDNYYEKNRRELNILCDKLRHVFIYKSQLVIELYLKYTIYPEQLETHDIKVLYTMMKDTLGQHSISIQKKLLSGYLFSTGETLNNNILMYLQKRVKNIINNYDSIDIKEEQRKFKKIVKNKKTIVQHYPSNNNDIDKVPSYLTHKEEKIIEAFESELERIDGQSRNGKLNKIHKKARFGKTVNDSEWLNEMCELLLLSAYAISLSYDSISLSQRLSDSGLIPYYIEGRRYDSAEIIKILKDGINITHDQVGENRLLETEYTEFKDEIDLFEVETFLKYNTGNLFDRTSNERSDDGGIKSKKTNILRAIYVEKICTSTESMTIDMLTHLKGKNERDINTNHSLTQMIQALENMSISKGINTFDQAFTMIFKECINYNPTVTMLSEMDIDSLTYNDIIALVNDSEPTITETKKVPLVTARYFGTPDYWLHNDKYAELYSLIFKTIHIYRELIRNYNYDFNKANEDLINQNINLSDLVSAYVLSDKVEVKERK